MPNILVTSLGTTWSIIPELLGFTNSDDFKLYKDHPNFDKIKTQRTDFDIQPVDEIWIITTNGLKVKDNLKNLEKWVQLCQSNLPKIHTFSYNKLIELNSINEIKPMSDLVYRVVLHAKEAASGGKLSLSLAGGRKNLSADVQNAASIFGCDALIHVMDNGKINKKFFNIEGFKEPLPGKEIECFYPLVLQDKMEPSPILFVEPKIKAKDFPLLNSLDQYFNTSLLDTITSRRKQSANSLLSIYHKRNTNAQSSYTVFHLLRPDIVEKLQKEKIGSDPNHKRADLAWLKKIPKAELHCHFGGILSPGEMIQVATELNKEVIILRKINPDFNSWLNNFKIGVQNNSLKNLISYNPKNFRNYWKEKSINEPFAIAGILITFKDNKDLLQQYIYQNITNFKGIGIESYEKLGDLQGSSLLQTEKTIRKACKILKQQCITNNIRYIEVRCSPENYIRGGLTGEQVVRFLMDELQMSNTKFKLIFIASRHGNKDVLQRHIDLALSMLKSNKEFRSMFVGFDLAGAEHARSPKELRNDFMRILERSIPTTIHAGEDMSVANIWEAIYHLSAERIGHGLTLNDNEDLKKRIKERKIAIELCPSSNDQIIGFKDFLQSQKNKIDKIYPLKQYLKEGLKVTINTDDPGISLTTLSKEYYKAACMTKGGLTKWEILQINRNSFKYGFLPMDEKKKLLLDVETELFDVINEANSK